MKAIIVLSIALCLVGCGQGSSRGRRLDTIGSLPAPSAVEITREGEAGVGVGWVFDGYADSFRIEACSLMSAGGCADDGDDWHDVAVAFGTKRFTAFHFDFVAALSVIELRVRIRALVSDEATETAQGSLALGGPERNAPAGGASLAAPDVHQVALDPNSNAYFQGINREPGATLILERISLGYLDPRFGVVDSFWQEAARRSAVPAGRFFTLRADLPVSPQPMRWGLRVLVQKNGQTLATETYEVVR